MIDDPRSIGASWPDARIRMIAELATTITEAPWSLTRDHLARARTAGLSDDDVLHVVALSAYFGHLNRIADVTGVPLDYNVQLRVPPPDHAVAGWPTAARLLTGRPALELSRRPATANALAEWRKYIFFRDAPITRRQRTLLARLVATWLGDGGISSPEDLTVNPTDGTLQAFAELVTLRPWAIGDAELAPLRGLGLDDAAIFDVTATITSAGVFSRIEVALMALAQ